MSDAVLYPLLAIAGLTVGSMLDLVIIGVPEGRPIGALISGSCPADQHPAHRNKVPVLVWVLSRGRCANCGEPLSAAVPLVAISNMVFWLLAGWRFGSEWILIGYLGLFSVLLTLSVIDAKWSILPNRITYPSAIVSFVAVVPLSFAHADPLGKVLGSWVSGLAYAGFLWFLLVFWKRVMGRDGMGGGDVKLALTLGIWLGFIHPVLVVLGVLAASLLGTIVGLLVIIVTRRNAAFPFGPWLALGTAMVILGSRPLLAFYGIS